MSEMTTQPMPRLRCVRCSAPLGSEPSNTLTCTSCGYIYEMTNGRPVILTSDNPLFTAAMYDAEPAPDKNPHTAHHRSEWHALRRNVKSLTPSRSINLARRDQLKRFESELGPTATNLLVLGCGTQRGELEALFSTSSHNLTFVDISPQAHADIFCDAHQLPFQDDSFSGVITTAVLEHVLDPVQVMTEIARVLATDGLLYSEIPFLQAVHEGAYDFTRFSLSGHRYLLRQFEEISAGMVAGPGTALVWALTEFGASLFRSRRISQLATLLTRWLFGWLKYADIRMRTNPRAMDAASCTYFLGRKTNQPATARSIVQNYEASRGLC